MAPASYDYHPAIREALLEHGLAPRGTTPPDRVREALSELYRFEIRRLRAALIAGRIARRDYADHVILLRRRYPLLSIPVEGWTRPSPTADAPE